MKPSAFGEIPNVFKGRGGVGFFALIGLVVAVPLIYTGTTDVHRARVILAGLPFLIVSVFEYSKHGPRLALSTIACIGSALLGVGLVVGAFRSPHQVAAWIRIIELVWCFCMVVFVAHGVARRPGRILVLLFAIAASYCISNYRFIIEWLSLENPRSRDWAFSIPGYFYYRNLGFAAAPAILILSWLPFSEWVGRLELSRKRVVQVMACGAAILGWGVLAWSGSRAGFFSAFAGLFIVAVLGRDRFSPFGFIGASIGIMLIGSIASIPFTPDEGSFGFLRIISRAVSSADGVSVSEYSSGRTVIWMDALERLRSSWLFGLGPDQYQYQPSLPSRILEPHNIFINVLVEGGLFGLVGFCLIVFAVLRILLKARVGEAKLLLMGLAALFAAYSLVDGTFVWTLPLVFQAIVIGCCFGLSGGCSEGQSRTLQLLLKAKQLVFSLTMIAFVAMGSLTLYQARALVFQKPSPDSFAARSVYEFPATTWGVTSWLSEWEENGYEEIDRWYIMLIEESPAPFFYRIEYGYYLIRNKRPVEALSQLERALKDAPLASLGRLHAQHDPIIGDLKSFLRELSSNKD